MFEFDRLGLSLIITIEVTVEWAKTMTWKGVKPVVKLVETVYKKGVRITKKAFKTIADRINRDEALPKYYVTIQPQS